MDYDIDLSVCHINSHDGNMACKINKQTNKPS